MNTINLEPQVQNLMQFLDNSPCNFYAAANVAKMLDEAGFTRLNPSDRWTLNRGGKYYTLKMILQYLHFVLAWGMLMPDTKLYRRIAIPPVFVLNRVLRCFVTEAS